MSVSPLFQEYKNAMAYVAGVIVGDGWCGSYDTGLRCADEDFALAFSDALAMAGLTKTQPYIDERGYWVVKASNLSGRFNHLLSYEPEKDSEMAMWLRGFFDSDGGAYLIHRPSVSENAWARSIRFFNTELAHLERAQQYLEYLGLPSYLRKTNSHLHPSHKGDKIVYVLTIRGSKANYIRFGTMVGSSLARKQKILNEIPKTYQSTTGYCRRGQLKGAATKRRRMLNRTMPRVISEIADLIEQGVKPTIANCEHIKGYSTVRRDYLKHSEMVEKAKELL